jgi:hypothetical protein
LKNPVNGFRVFHNANKELCVVDLCSIYLASLELCWVSTAAIREKYAKQITNFGILEFATSSRCSFTACASARIYAKEHVEGQKQNK